jgi:hypothetical protein
MIIFYNRTKFKIEETKELLHRNQNSKPRTNSRTKLKSRDTVNTEEDIHFCSTIDNAKIYGYEKVDRSNSRVIPVTSTLIQRSKSTGKIKINKSLNNSRNIGKTINSIELDRTIEPNDNIMDIRAHLNNYYSTKHENKKNNYFREYMTSTDDDNKLSTVDLMKKIAIDERRIKPVNNNKNKESDHSKYRGTEFNNYRSNYLDDKPVNKHDEDIEEEQYNPWSPVQRGKYNFRDYGIGNSIKRKRDEDTIDHRGERNINITPNCINRPITNKRLQDLNTIASYASNFVNTNSTKDSGKEDGISYLDYIRNGRNNIQCENHRSDSPINHQNCDARFELEHPEYFRYLKEKANQRRQEDVQVGGDKEFHRRDKGSDRLDNNYEDGVFTFKDRGNNNTYNPSNREHKPHIRVDDDRLDYDGHVQNTDGSDLNKPDFVYNKPIGIFILTPRLLY